MSAGIERLTGVVESLLVELTGVLGQAATLGLLAELRDITALARPGTISREDMEQHMALLDAVESPEAVPRPAVSVAGQAMADFESYRESCGEHARTPVPFGIFHLLWQRTRREKLSAETVAFALRRAEAALRR